MGDGRFPLKRRGVEGEVFNGRQLARRAPQRDDGPSPEDLERFGGVTRTCPACGKEVYDDASQCYHCGHALDGADRQQLPKVWVVVVVLILIASIAFFVTR
ncbi:MAG TPA: zinc-ribbon domain-containing protein [Phycisphaerales bacterium]|nr:zinc-ribbon domain-containing protein [Phycisphaerales bacterium]